MPQPVFRQVKNAFSNLNPRAVREAADRPVSIAIVAASAESLGRMETYLAPAHLSPDRRAQSVRMLKRGGSGCDVEIYESSLLRPARAFSFDPEAPDDCVRRILRAREDLMLPLARNLYPFRKQAVHRIIRILCERERAVLPGHGAARTCCRVSYPSPGPRVSFGSDAAFLTMNQMRMAFSLAAASDRPVGYREQKGEIASLVAGAFGWRALARELIGKVPFGGGLIPKAAIAYAGTVAVGVSLERLYRLGYGFTREERRAVYEEAYLNGRQLAEMLLAGLRKPRAKSEPPMLYRAG